MYLPCYYAVINVILLDFYCSPKWTLMAIDGQSELKSSLQNCSMKPCPMLDTQVSDSQDSILKERAITFRLCSLQDSPHVKRREEPTPLPCVVYGFNLLQLSEHEFQVWSQFVTQGIVKNVFQKNLGTEVAQEIIWILSLQDSSFLSCFLGHTGRLQRPFRRVIS